MLKTILVYNAVKCSMAWLQRLLDEVNANSFSKKNIQRVVTTKGVSTVLSNIFLRV